jgi:hypothetical protein
MRRVEIHSELPACIFKSLLDLLLLYAALLFQNVASLRTSSLFSRPDVLPIHEIVLQYRDQRAIIG